MLGYTAPKPLTGKQQRGKGLGVGGERKGSGEEKIEGGLGVEL